MRRVAGGAAPDNATVVPNRGERKAALQPVSHKIVAAAVEFRRRDFVRRESVRARAGAAPKRCAGAIISGSA
jgi:hypothetical protein